MKPKGMANQPEQNPSIESRGTPTESGLDVETKVFSASGRGRTFFLTSLFIELIDAGQPVGGCE
jgi:kynureninase